MSELVRARVEERLLKLRLGAVAQRLDGILSQAARGEPTYLDFLDQILTEETEAKQKKRVAMGIQIAHFPAVKTIEEFDFKFQPSIDQKLVRELATVQKLVVVVTLHDLNQASLYGDRLAILCRRSLMALGSPPEVLTAELISQAFGIPVTVYSTNGLPPRFRSGNGSCLFLNPAKSPFASCTTFCSSRIIPSVKNPARAKSWAAPKAVITCILWSPTWQLARFR